MGGDHAADFVVGDCRPLCGHGPQQLQHHTCPAQLTMDRRPIRPHIHRGNCHRGRIEPRFQNLVGVPSGRAMTGSAGTLQ